MVEILTTVLIVVAILIGGIFIVPGAASSISSIVLNQPQKCDIAPFAPSCYCGEGFTKQPLSTPGKSYCESANLMFDPLDPNFETQTIAYAKAYLREHFPECDSVECPEPATLLSDADVVWGPEHRSVYFECRTPWGKDYWEARLSLETGNVEKVFCNNIETPPPIGELPGTIIVTDPTPSFAHINIENFGIFQQEYLFRGTCIETNGKATTTINAPLGIEVEKWGLSSGGWGFLLVGNRFTIVSGGNPIGLQAGVCVLKNQTPTAVNMECDARCPSTIGQSQEGRIWGHISTSYMKSNFCEKSDLNPAFAGKYASVGEKQCCNSIRKYKICDSSLQWVIDTTPNISCRTTGDSC